MPGITMRGPLCTKRGKPVGEAVEKGIDDLLAVGENLVIEMMHSEGPYDGKPFTPGGNKRVVTGNYQRRITSFRKGLHGEVYDGGTIYGPWLEGVSSRNQRTRFKGYSHFRRTLTRLKKTWRGHFEPRIWDGVRDIGGGR